MCVSVPPDSSAEIGYVAFPKYLLLFTLVKQSIWTLHSVAFKLPKSKKKKKIVMSPCKYNPMVEHEDSQKLLMKNNVL